MDRNDWWLGLDATAGLVDALADRVGPIVWSAERFAGPDTWIGPAADDALVAIGAATRGAGEAAFALRRVAADMRARAAAARAAAAAAAREEALAP